MKRIVFILLLVVYGHRWLTRFKLRMGGIYTFGYSYVDINNDIANSYETHYVDRDSETTEYPVGIFFPAVLSV